ncbi:RNA-binding cell elongation regulator Jag/EloR [Chloroflexota bacterium]
MEEAIQHALEQLGTSRDEIEITVLKEGKSGILGLGVEEAKIRVKPLTHINHEDNPIAEKAKSVLELMLSKMGVRATVVPHFESFIEKGKEDENSPIAFNIKGEDLGILIGRRGQTLACLQYIVRIITTQYTKSWAPIIIDVEGYKQRRYQVLQALALRIAEQVRTRGIPFRLEPMPAYERRVVHLALADHQYVVTDSVGEGEARRVVVSLK